MNRLAVMDHASRMLALRSDADETEIRRTYFRLARRCHPDVDRSPGATARFQQLTHAYRQRLAAAPRKGSARSAAPRATEPTSLERAIALGLQKAMARAPQANKPVTAEIGGIRIVIRFR